MNQDGVTDARRPVHGAGRLIAGPAAWAPAYVAAALLLWAVYDQGAFLHPSKTIVALGMPALGLLHALARRYRRHATLRWSMLDGLFLALCLFGGLSAIWSIDPVKSLRAAGVLLGGLFFLRLGRDIGFTSPRTRHGLLLALAILGTLVSVLAIVGYAFSVPRLSILHEGELMATGTFGYANALAAFLVLTLAVTAAYSLDSPTGKNRLLLLAASASVQIGALALSRSRAVAAVVILLAAIFAIVRLLTSVTNVWRNRVIGVALAGLLVAGIYYVVSLWLGQFRPWGPMTADVFRVNTWKAALQAAAERPVIGYGLDTFYQAYAPFKEGAHTTYAHNIFIQQLVENGAVGVALLAAFLASATVVPLAVLTGRARDPKVPLLLGAQAFVLLNLVDLSWYFPALLFIFSWLLGTMGSYGGERCYAAKW